MMRIMFQDLIVQDHGVGQISIAMKSQGRIELCLALIRAFASFFPESGFFATIPLYSRHVSHLRQARQPKLYSDRPRQQRPGA